MRKLKLDELDRISVEEFKQTEKLPVCIVLDNIRSLHNVGSAFRTSDAFKLEKVYLTGITGQPPHREIEKTALGATASVDWEHAEKTADVLRSLKEKGYTIIAVEHTSASESLNHFHPGEGTKYCLVFGNEVNGVSEEAIALADKALEIPQHGTKHSLNISVCLGI
ncbi:MAG TPA: RNA methyltransferase, partial [Chryseosolibacter sp.]|nr:RNA methyltransferase [Chryseosolibacter sp.]